MSLLHAVVTVTGVGFSTVSDLAVLAPIPSTSVVCVLVFLWAVPARYLREWAKPPRVFDAVAYATVVWVSFDLAAAN